MGSKRKGRAHCRLLRVCTPVQSQAVVKGSANRPILSSSPAHRAIERRAACRCRRPHRRMRRAVVLAALLALAAGANAASDSKFAFLAMGAARRLGAAAGCLHCWQSGAAMGRRGPPGSGTAGCATGSCQLARQARRPQQPGKRSQPSRLPFCRLAPWQQTAPRWSGSLAQWATSAAVQSTRPVRASLGGDPTAAGAAAQHWQPQQADAGMPHGPQAPCQCPRASSHAPSAGWQLFTVAAVPAAWPSLHSSPTYHLAEARAGWITKINIWHDGKCVTGIKPTYGYRCAARSMCSCRLTGGSRLVTPAACSRIQGGPVQAHRPCMRLSQRRTGCSPRRGYA